MSFKGHSRSHKLDNVPDELDLHKECKNQCRSSIIWQSIQQYPQSVSIANWGELPLHTLLRNPLSSIDDVLMVIEKYPAALQYLGVSNNLPLHCECMTQCRSAIISKCIELHPEALAMTNESDHLPLHLLLTNESSSINDALMMIEKYPAALEQKTNLSHLPLHLECGDRARRAVISKCIDRYPESLAVTDKGLDLPLHRCLSNSRSSVETALMMIEKYPAAVKHQNFFNRLPIHVECKFLCRLAVIRQCVELYPSSLQLQDYDLKTPLTRVIYQIYATRTVIEVYKFLPALSCLANANPTSYSKLIVDPGVEYVHRAWYICWSQDYLRYRILLNLALDEKLPPDFLLQKCDLNWQPRSSLIHLMLQMIHVERNDDDSCEVNCTTRQFVLHKMIRRSSLANAIGHVYAVCQSDELGDHLLRHVMSYL
jgi:hypothetical protein